VQEQPQEDAQEFIQHFLSKLHEELAEVRPPPCNPDGHGRDGQPCFAGPSSPLYSNGLADTQQTRAGCTEAVAHAR